MVLPRQGVVMAVEDGKHPKKLKPRRRFSWRATDPPLHNRKRPAGEAGRFWGYYREERLFISIYVWIRGR
jgi:hypothetical protein